MRTAWRLGVLTVHNYTPCTTKHTIKVVTGLDAINLSLIYLDAELLGCFKISGMRSLPNCRPVVEDTLLIAVVKRHMGVSLHEFSNGVNLSDGCFTLYNDVVTFDPALIRAVLKNIDCTKYGERLYKLRQHSVNTSGVINGYPLLIQDPSITGYTETCPRCGEDIDWERFQSKVNKRKKEEQAQLCVDRFFCSECSLMLYPYS